MKKMKKRSKGFTLTELAIVIAVIAILVAVLVPTFTSLIKKAEESSDKQLVKNLNTILTTDESISGNVESMSDAVAVAESNGYNVANLSPTSSGYDILWDQVNNRFLLVNEDNQVVYADSATGLSEGETVTAAYTYWRIIESESDYEKYSAEDYSLYITTDLDVETVTSNGGVEYADGVTSKATTVTADTTTTTTSTTSAESKALASTAIKTASGNASLPLVIVKTNGGSLTVEVTGDATVKHNGTADSVALNGSTTYFRNASIKYDVEINSADVTYIPPEDEELKAETVSIVITSSVTTTTDAQKIITMLETTCADSNITIGATTNILASVTTTTTTIEIVTSIISTDFAGGLGTESSPYMIATAEQFVKIGDYSSDMGSKSYKYFTLTNDIDLRNINFTSTYVSLYFCGQLDGAGYTLISNDDLSHIFVNAVGGSTVNTIIFKDLTYLLNENNVGLCKGLKNTYTSVTFDNVDIGMVDTSNTISLIQNGGVYLDWAGYSSTNGWIRYSTYNFIDCDCSVNISNATSYNAVFIGGGIYWSKVTVDNCSYSGKYIGQQCGLVLGNATTSYMPSKYGLTINSFTNTGTVLGTSYKPVLAGASSSTGISSANYYVNEDNITLGGTIKYLSDSGLAISTDTNGQYVITEGTGAGSYSLTIQAGIRHLIRSNGSNSENSSYSFTLNLGSISFTNGKYETGFYTGYFATKAQYLKLVDSTETFSNVTWYDITSESGAKVCMIKYKESDNSYTYYYVFDFSNTAANSTFTSIYFATKSNSVYTSACVATKQGSVSSYDSDGEIQGTAYTN